MTELELLKRYNDLRTQIYELQFEIKFCHLIGEKEVLEKKSDQLNAALASVEYDLIHVADKSASYHSKQRVIAQLNQYIKHISSARHGLKLTRNQGLVFENHLFSIIIQDIYYVAVWGWDAVSIPNLYYAWEDSQAVETSAVIEFLKEEKQIVQNLPAPNYVGLYRYFEDFKIRMGQRFMPVLQETVSS